MVVKRMCNVLESGQTLLIIVLVMVVALTVGLSVSLRSITSQRTSSEEERSQRALSAAEAGVEQALKTGLPISNYNFSGNNSVIKKVSVQSVSGTQFNMKGGNLISKDDGADLWFVPHLTGDVPDYSTPWSGTFNLYWGTSSAGCDNAALEVVVLSGTSKNDAVSTRYAFDPCSRGNNFTPATVGSVTIDSNTYFFNAPITVANAFIARVIPLYNDSPVGIIVTSLTPLPEQGKKIESVGSSVGTERKITFFKGFLELPFFSYILFLNKQ